jgi:hypothetical protein
MWNKRLDLWEKYYTCPKNKECKHIHKCDVLQLQHQLVNIQREIFYNEPFLFLQNLIICKNCVYTSY